MLFNGAVIKSLVCEVVKCFIHVFLLSMCVIILTAVVMFVQGQGHHVDSLTACLKVLRVIPAVTCTLCYMIIKEPETLSNSSFIILL